MMRTFRTAEEFVHWLLGRYEIVPYEDGDARLRLIKDVEEVLRQQEPGLVLLALREKPNTPSGG